jgi:BirA family biotin operon repressor/biotin-[acetyl-CoA-carboxylase] ligase
MGAPDLSGWQDALEAVAARLSHRIADRVMVLAETASTQDAARALADGRPGLVVVAGRQTGGRGRLGRRWSDPGGHGLALTLVLDAGRCTPGFASLAAGVAAAEAVVRSVPVAPVGLRWPNDVVEKSSGRKVGGALIERFGTVLAVGVGVNVLQREHDWPAELRGIATSIAELGGGSSRIDVGTCLLQTLDEAFGASPESLADRWRRRDVLTGRAAAFVHDSRRHEGTVEGIDPASHIVLRLPSGERIRLPALTTSLVRE